MGARRVDIHAPSTFDPAKYTYKHLVYLGTSKDTGEFVTDMNADLPHYLIYRKDNGHLGVHGGIEGNFSRKGTCDHCGAWFLYGAIFEHDNGERIVVGNTCAVEAFGCDSRVEYDRKRLVSRVKAGRERAKLEAKREAFLTNNEGLADALECEHYIVRDIRYKFSRYGELSPKQVALVFKISKETKEFEEKKEKQESELNDVVEGRRELTGKILMAKWYENAFGIQYKCLLLTDDNQKLFGTVPAKLADADVGKGDKVKFTATVKASVDDSKFGYYSRPTKAEILEKVEKDV